MSENVKKKSVTDEIEELRAAGNYVGAEFLLNELKTVKKNDVVVEKLARRKEVTKEIEELRSVGNYTGAEFLLNELKSLNKTIKLFRK
jgi:hypothetical protein